jgi:hypothetical protein
MKASLTLVALTLAAASSAQAFSADAKKLARFDMGYARCEQKFEQMRGHRDEAYLALWKLRADEKSRSQLAALRKSAVYKSETRVAQATASRASSPDLDARWSQQCQATWAQAQSVTAAAPPPAAASKAAH